MIAGVKCDKCLVNLTWEEALKHFEECDRHSIQYIRMLTDNMASDIRHMQFTVTTTSGAACPRQEVIRRVLPVYVHPDAVMPRLMGTVLHKVIASYTPNTEDWVCERCTCPDPLPLSEEAYKKADSGETLDVVLVDGMYHTSTCDRVKCRMEGTVFGVKVSGLVDAFRYVSKENNVIDLYDFKFRSQYGARFAEEVKPSDAVQMNINRILAEQNGYSVRNMYIVAFFWSTGSVIKIPHMSEDDIAVSVTGLGRDGGNPPTTYETMNMLENAYAKIRKIIEEKGIEALTEDNADVIGVIRDLPLVGREKYKSGARSMCTAYCDVATTCRAIGTSDEPESTALEYFTSDNSSDDGLFI